MEDIKIKLVAIAKDEAAYLPEWIFHHLSVGVDAIDIYVNSTTDNTYDIADKLSSLPNIRFINADHIFVDEHQYPQEITYTQAHKECLDTDFTHLMFLDIDEYWTSKDPKIGLKELLRNLNYPKIVSFNWFNKYQEEEFSDIYTEKLLGANGRQVKTLFSLDINVEKIDAHNIKAMEETYYLADGRVWGFETYQRNASFIRGDFFKRQSLDFFVLHRMYRSQLEYVSCLVRGNPHLSHRQASKFKINRNGYHGRYAKGEEIVFDAVSVASFKDNLHAFLTKYDLLVEVEKGRVFVRNRFETAVALIEKSGRDEYKVINRVLLNSRNQKVCAAHHEFKKRLKFETDNQVVDTLKNTAISIQDVNLNLAFDLMNKALEIRPKGKWIQTKIREYEERLALK